MNEINKVEIHVKDEKDVEEIFRLFTSWVQPSVGYLCYVVLWNEFKVSGQIKAADSRILEIMSKCRAESTLWWENRPDRKLFFFF